MQIDKLHHCTKCGVQLTTANWYPSIQCKRYYICKKCYYVEQTKRPSYKLYRLKNREKSCLREVERRRKIAEGSHIIKPKILIPKCRRCGVRLDSSNWHPRRMRFSDRLCNPCVPLDRREKLQRYNTDPAYRLRNNARVHYWKIAREFGLTARDLEKMLTSQNGLCGICATDITSKPYLDHDHVNGYARGLLCNQCNIGLARFKDRTDFIQLAISYLSKDGENGWKGNNITNALSRRSKYKEMTEREMHLWKKYRLTPQELEFIIHQQDGKCAICEVYILEKPYVDHNHSTGRIRGLLCNACNNGLAMFKDNIEIMKKAIEYLEKYQSTPIARGSTNRPVRIRTPLTT